MNTPPDGHEGKDDDTNDLFETVVDFFDRLEAGEEPDGDRRIPVNIPGFLSLFDRVALPDDIFERGTRSAKLGGAIVAMLETSESAAHAALMLELSRRKHAEDGILPALDYVRTRYPDYNSAKISVDIEDRTAAIEELMKLPENAGRVMLFSQSNGWRRSKQFEPYEHNTVRGLRVGIDTDPKALSTTMTAHISFRPGSFGGSIENMLQLPAVRDAVENYPFFSTREDLVRNVEVNAGRKYVTEGGGTGRYFKLADDMEATIEFGEAGIMVSYRPTKEASKELSAGEESPEDKQAKLQTVVERQLDFAGTEVPRIFGVIMQAFNGHDAYTKHVLEAPRTRTREEEEWYKKFQREEDHTREIPEVLKDPRHIDLFRSIVQPRPETSFEMVGGLDEAVLRMQRAVRKAKNPAAYKIAGLNPKPSVLLVGPPGCGKTMLAEAAAHMTDSMFLSARGSDILSMWAGEAEKNVAALFEMTQLIGTKQSVVLFLDEIESLAPSRNGSHMMEHERKVTAEFLSMLNATYPNCLILAATNDATHVDPAVIRSGRFNDIIPILEPDTSGREKIITNWMESFTGKAEVPVFDDSVSARELARVTEKMTGADLKTLLQKAIEDAVDESVEQETEFKPVDMSLLLRKKAEMVEQKQTGSTGMYL
jgi:SpoVK/Ycf46/Vps4 family AAA+-type ATPase